ncbi:hypothetical protein QFC21_000147 [Naganishia friedmannii]|uniref:Uncharacterized protein n=1 Tax=Naganishia friedmannii TaxID=89922 RepID=A0ACC2WE93_9TREE|nr:hypothetical protein QFC21_000147 [Naganishia friedmannii]
MTRRDIKLRKQCQPVRLFEFGCSSGSLKIKIESCPQIIPSTPTKIAETEVSTLRNIRLLSLLADPGDLRMDDYENTPLRDAVQQLSKRLEITEVEIKSLRLQKETLPVQVEDLRTKEVQLSNRIGTFEQNLLLDASSDLCSLSSNSVAPAVNRSEKKPIPGMQNIVSSVEPEKTFDHWSTIGEKAPDRAGVK